MRLCEETRLSTAMRGDAAVGCGTLYGDCANQSDSAFPPEGVVEAILGYRKWGVMKMQDMLQFLSDLEKNNSLEWMAQNKKAYVSAKKAFVALVQELVVRMGEVDDSIPLLNAGDLVFRLNRDTRFSKDKSPYNAAFRAHIAPAGKLPVPVGYYISVAPGDRSFLGGGLFAPMFKDATARVRDHIAADGAAFEKIIGTPAFERHFSIKGEALKSVPNSYDANHPQAEYLKNKSWYLEYPVADSLMVDTQAFVNKAVTVFGLMKPFNQFLNSALAGFRMPERK